MRGVRGTLALGAVLLALPASVAVAEPVAIDVEDSYFNPGDYQDTVASGTTVNWSWGAGDTNEAHSVNGSLFGTGSISAAGNYTIEPSAGTYQYFCGNHSLMTGVLRFGMPTPVVAPDGTYPVVWATETSFSQKYYDVQYRKGTGKWKKWLWNTGKLKGTFGRNGKPVTPQPGKSYTVRARTKNWTLPSSVRSDWSPTLTVQVPE